VAQKERRNPPRKRTKVIVIGLDGATFDVIYPLVQRGKLPTFSFLLKKGCSARLKSVYPRWSAPAWVSLVTGKNPGKHSVFSFLRLKPDGGVEGVVSSRCIRGETIWDILSTNGKKVVIINVPVTYPPKPVNGIMISGFLTPSSSCDFTYPRWLKDMLKDYKIDVADAFKRTIVSLPYEDLAKLYRELTEVLESRRRLVKRLIKALDWDFFMVVFMVLDRAQHFFWHTLRTENDIVSFFYSKIDDVLSELLGLLDEDTMVFVVSDHGFGPAPRRLFHVNTWLMEKGFLVLRKESLLRVRLLSKLRRLLTPLIKLFEKIIVLLGMRVLVMMKRAALWSEESIAELVDWSRTRAYGMQFGIRINLEGREPNGIVKPHDYHTLRDILMEKLRQVRDPRTGGRVFKAVLRREDVYKGEFVELAPDIILIPEDDYRLAMTLEDSWITDEAIKLPSGDHRSHGIFIAYGKRVKEGVSLGEVSIFDIAPTIMYVFGLNVPDDMDGRILRGIFQKAGNGEHENAS